MGLDAPQLQQRANRACIQPRHFAGHILRGSDREHPPLPKLGRFLLGHSFDHAGFLDFEVSTCLACPNHRLGSEVDIIRVYYWFGEYYSATLLTQAIVMIVVQSVLLKVALDNRPSSGGRHGIEHAPFSDAGSNAPTRPYEFWQWKNDKP